MNTNLISREAAIALLDGMSFYSGRDDWSAGFDAAIEKAVEALTNMPSAVTVTGSPTLTITYTDDKP